MSTLKTDGTVSGIVDLPYQEACAESDARGVLGVIGVTNLIHLADTQRTKPQPKEAEQNSLGSPLPS